MCEWKESSAITTFKPQQMKSILSHTQFLLKVKKECDCYYYLQTQTASAILKGEKVPHLCSSGDKAFRFPFPVKIFCKLEAHLNSFQPHCRSHDGGSSPQSKNDCFSNSLAAQEAETSASWNGHPETLLDQDNPGQSEWPINFFLCIVQWIREPPLLKHLEVIKRQQKEPEEFLLTKALYWWTVETINFYLIPLFKFLLHICLQIQVFPNYISDCTYLELLYLSIEYPSHLMYFFKKLMLPSFFQ